MKWTATRGNPELVEGYYQVVVSYSNGVEMLMETYTHPRPAGSWLGDRVRTKLKELEEAGSA